MKTRWLVFAALLLGLAGCGDGSGGEAGTAPGPGAEKPEGSIDDIIVVHSTDPVVKTMGRFERVDGGPLAVGREVLKSAGEGEASASFAVPVPRPGYYDVSVRWPSLAASPAAVDIVVDHRLGRLEAGPFDQSQSAGEWISLGVLPFDGVVSESVVWRKRAASVLIVDALRLRWQGETALALHIRDTAIPIGQVNNPYSAKLVAQGGVPPYRWSSPDRALPPGLSLDGANGSLSGTLTGAGSFVFPVAVRDAAGGEVTAEFLLEVVAEDHPPDSESDLRALREIVRTMPEGEWRSVSLNEFSSVWPPAELRTGYYGQPRRIIPAWSSFAWDRNRDNLILYGGGHANYSGNEVYFWRGSTRRWERASLPSEIRQDLLGVWHAADGPHNAPVSAHTYDNSIFLPIVDRFFTLGGAAFNGGSSYRLENGGGRTGPYLFDPRKAHPMKVGGTTGSHVQRNGSETEIIGGRMWLNRDAFANGTLSMPSWYNFVEGCTAYNEENGKDVVYVRQYYALYRYTLHDVNDPKKDTWEKVGSYGGGSLNQTSCGYDPVRKLFVRTYLNETPFRFWNLNTPGPSNPDEKLTPFDPTGEFDDLRGSGGIVIPKCGLDHDRARGRFALWCGGGAVWMLYPPPLEEPASGRWTIQRQRPPVGTVPSADVGTGILGKWEYAPDLDVFVALEGAFVGNVWLYKPSGWSEPTDSR